MPKELRATLPPSQGVGSVTTLSLPSNRPGILGLGVSKCRLGGISLVCMAMMTLVKEENPVVGGESRSYERIYNYI